MAEVRSAIHVRTGQRAASMALDNWLSQHAVDVAGFADVYDACVHLLKRYERIPDVAFVGADWLADDEFSLVAYIRQTWPRTLIVVYGAAPAPVRADLLPLTQTCYGEAALQGLLAGTPTELVGRHAPEGPSPRTAPPIRPETPPAVRTVEGLPAMRPTKPEKPPAEQRPAADRPNLGPPSVESPRAILTAEELSALLDRPEEE